MELRIENGRGKWRTVKITPPHDKFYKALRDALGAAEQINLTIDPDRVQDMFYPVVSHGIFKTGRAFVKKISGGFAYVVDRLPNAAYDGWLAVELLTAGGEKPKREVSPEQREKLAKNLEKARAARGKK